MKNNKLKIFSFTLGILILAILLVNFGLNFWVKRNLSGYLKERSEYIITYKTLDVDLVSGGISATGITINNQNPDRTDKVGLQGTVDSLTVSQLGLYDLLIHRSVSTNNLVLSSPNLNIVLPKPRSTPVAKRKEFSLRNISITNGTVQVFKATQQKVLAVHDLDFSIEDLEMKEDGKEGGLPFTFDKYRLKAKNIYYRPDNVYAFTSSEITTSDGMLTLQNFAMNPLLSYGGFLRFYPKKRNLFHVQAPKIELKDFSLRKKKLSLSDVRFINADVKMYTTDAQSEQKKKSFTYEVDLQKLALVNMKLTIVKRNDHPLFSAQQLSMNIDNLLMNEETAQGNIPFNYQNFSIAAQDLNYVTATQHIKVGKVNLSPKKADLAQISVVPITKQNDISSFDLQAVTVSLAVNKWGFVDNKLQLEVQDVSVDRLRGSIVSGNGSGEKKNDYGGIHFPLKVAAVTLKNADLRLESKGQPISIKNLNASFQNIEMNAQTVKDKLPFKTGNYKIAGSNFLYQTKFYDLSAAQLKLNSTELLVSNFAMKPKVSRAQFIRMIPAEKDLYDLQVSSMHAVGTWDLLSNNKFLNLSSVVVNKASANIFRSKIPADDLTEKVMYSKLLRSVKFPLYVANLQLQNSLLVYEEDTKASAGPGKLVFSDFNMTVKDLNSGKMKGKPTLVPITIQCKFMETSPMNVKWSFDTANGNDAFAISGSVGDLPAPRINKFIEPYLKIRATGLISQLLFDFKGNRAGLQGSLKMEHRDLKVSVLKETGEKDKILSAIVNIFVKTDSGNYPASVQVEEVKRDVTKSFFNLFWRGIEQGLKKTLIGTGAPKTEASVKKTVAQTKSALKENKKDLQERPKMRSDRR